MAFLLGAAAFVVALLVSVMLHEGGHLLTAKRFGMKATQYFVGFGPTLWSRRRGETEYGVKALPLGGFVKIVGYTPLEEIAEEDRERAFYRQPAGRRAVVIAAGVVANFAFAFLLLAVTAMTLGELHLGTPSTTVDKVADCVPAGASTSCSGRPRSPAKASGIEPGDRIEVFNGTPVADWSQFRKAIDKTKPGQAVPVVIRRGGTEQTLRITLADVDGASFVGISSKVVGRHYERKGPVGAAAYAGRTLGLMVKGVGKVAAGLPQAIPKLFSPDRASTPGGQVGSVVGATEVSGQIFSSHSTARDKTFLFLQLVVSVNVFLGALNVLPLLPLDGGHLAIVVWERVRAWLARLRGRPDPGPVDMTKLMPVTYLAVLVLVGLGLLLILADLFNPLQIPG
ncbi:M50 family metallopeptidase [Actinomadura rupiterrae]|uniref:M50 family metallopeptidase n=1 Tax=Actinomadura rupiterrae TaxID=559627 RepID=UPI0020A25CE5|nr:M50 family metallopeptidase [Actinomadura rupiterrae]MCP2339658.1 membrane-associated protease RseP (regulator of RpoE activity) [Actinomadura rupiterrae]